MVKALGGAAAALGIAAYLHGGGPVTLAWGALVLLSGATIALTANALNLFDLRPLRALKVFSLAALPLWLVGTATGSAAPIPAGLGALLGAGTVYARREARRQAMLGGCRCQPARRAPRPGRGHAPLAHAGGLGGDSPGAAPLQRAPLGQRLDPAASPGGGARPLGLGSRSRRLKGRLTMPKPFPGRNCWPR